MRENSRASDPVKAAISLRSAPAEKNLAASSNDQRFRRARQVMEPLGQRQYTCPRQAIGAVVRSQTQHPNAVMSFEMKELAS